MSVSPSDGPDRLSPSRAGRGLVVAAALLLMGGAAAWFLLAGRGVEDTELASDLFAGRESDIRELLGRIGPAGPLKALTVDYPLSGSVFPPEIVAPTFLWRNPDNAATRWLIDVSFETSRYHIYALVDGRRPKPVIDEQCVTAENRYQEPPDRASAKGWTPDERTWRLMKRHSTRRDLTVSVYGVESGGPASRGRVKLRTSADPVGAMVFYRDVPLMPSVTETGVIQPIAMSAMPLIKWRLRDLSKPSAPAVMEYIPTCANCHSFSRDGGTLTMDIDGPQGDKGAHVVVPVREHTFVSQENVFSWNSYPSGIKGLPSFGLFPQVSPDGKYVVASILETLYVQNYADYRFLQTFFPTAGVLAFRSRETGEIRRLSGADDPKFVHTNAVWSPDGKTLAFVRAPASEPDANAPEARFANDPNEAQVRFDVCTIPFNEGRGGVATPLPGASNNGMSNSFPKFSPDGKWIVFVQAKNAMLMRPDSRLYIIPAEGGTPRLMNCNAGPMNSWHSWSPNSRWLVFSSKRNTPYTQMFLTHVDENGMDTPAVLVPDSTVSNRAVNLPEFVSLAPGALVDITTPAVEFRRLVDRGEALLGKGQAAQAEELLRRSIELKSDYAPAHSSLGSALAKQGRPDEAEREFNRALELNPNYYYAHANLAILNARAGRHEQAIRHCKEVERINPNFHVIHLDWGASLYALGRYDEAIGHFKEILEGDAQNPAALANLGKTFLQMGKLETAADYLQRAVASNPRLAPAQMDLGITLRRMGKLDEAGDRFRRILEIDPNFYPAVHEWAVTLAAQGRTAEAVKRFRRAIDLNPQQPEVRDTLARILATHPDPAVRNGEEALAQATAACRLTRFETPEFLDTQAAAYAELGRFDEAVRAAEKALALAGGARSATFAADAQAHLELFRKRQPLRAGK